jgi:hypothetical protein
MLEGELAGRFINHASVHQKQYRHNLKRQAKKEERE